MLVIADTQLRWELIVELVKAGDYGISGVGGVAPRQVSINETECLGKECCLVLPCLYGGGWVNG